MIPEVELKNLESAPTVATKPPSMLKNHLASTMPVIIFSYIGVLIRIGLNFLGNYETPLSEAFWVNLIGCLIMGVLIEHKTYINSRVPEIYVGLTTGLCGSITTFSGYMHSSCIALYGPSSHDTYPVANYLSVAISVFSVSLTGFIIGRHVSAAIKPSSSDTPESVQHKKRHIRIIFFLIFTLMTIPLLVLLAVFLPVTKYTYILYSVIFAPFGALTRYTLSILLNKTPNFPFGTLLANVIGSYILLGTVAIHEYVNMPSLLVEQVVIGVIQGYCGCLTTVSTFILELNTIPKRRYTYVYGIITILLVQIVYIVLGRFFSYLCSPK